jgi:hypothetical protein
VFGIKIMLYLCGEVCVVVVWVKCVVGCEGRGVMKNITLWWSFFTGRCVCLVVLTCPVGPTLCCPANGTRLGVWFLDGGTHFCTNIYTDDHCLSHFVSLLVTLVCVCYLVYDRGAGFF